MTPEEIEREVKDLRERVDDLENEREAIKALPSAVAELKGALDVLQDIVVERMDGVTKKIDKASSVKTAAGYVAAIIVPILVALIGAYFALKSAQVQPR